MKKIEWIREALSAWPSPDYLKQRETAGWRMVAVEWEREVQVEAAPTSKELVPGEEIPYGTRIAGDCLHLEENPTEMQVLNHLAEMVVQDHSYNHMAQSLNERSFRTRDGKPWTALAVFKLTPRLIEVAPRILSSVDITPRCVFYSSNAVALHPLTCRVINGDALRCFHPGCPPSLCWLANQAPWVNAHIDLP